MFEIGRKLIDVDDLDDILRVLAWRRMAQKSLKPPNHALVVLMRHCSSFKVEHQARWSPNRLNISPGQRRCRKKKTSAPLPLNTSECCLYADDGYMKHIEILVRLICHSTVIVLSQTQNKQNNRRSVVQPQQQFAGRCYCHPFLLKTRVSDPKFLGSHKNQTQRLAETPILHCQILIALFLCVSVRMPSQNEIVYRKVESINLIIFLIYILLNLYIII